MNGAERRYLRAVAEQAPTEQAAHDAFIEERRQRMEATKMQDWEPVSVGPFEQGLVCVDPDCQRPGVVDNPYRGRFAPMCFYHAFVEALDEDPEAQRLALGWAIAEGLKTQKVGGR